MQCRACGAQLPAGSRVCYNCGVSVEAAPVNNYFHAASHDLGPSEPVRPEPTWEEQPEAVGGTELLAPSVPEPEVRVHFSAPVREAPEVPETEEPEKPEEPAEPFVKSAKRPQKLHRISAWRELRLLLRQGWLVMLGEKRNLIISLLFPFLAGAVTVWVAGEEMFINSDSTQSACFILVCAAIWGGLFNSIQSVVKERDNIKRDYVSGALRLYCYTGSRAFLQLVLCLIQSLVLSLAVPVLCWVYDNSLPDRGLLLDSVYLELLISLFLVMFAADSLGLLISCLVRKDELAGKLAPYVLIVQLLFSGVLFPMEGPSEILSGLMLSRWGMEAMGSSCNINAMEQKINQVVTEAADKIGGSGATVTCQTLDAIRQPVEAYDFTQGHLLMVWGILILFVIVPIVAGNFCLHSVKKDTR